MSDTDRPLFFGGLPPREATVVAERAGDAAPALKPQVDTAPAAAVSPLAIIALVSSFVVSVVGLVLGIIALRRIRRTGERGGRLAIAAILVGSVGLAILLAMVSITLIGGPSLAGSVAGITPHPHAPEPLVTPRPVSSAEAAQAAAATAAGGGAIPGHIVSAELCTAIKGYTAVGNGNASSTNVTPQQLAAMEQLAAVKSPNQPVYQRYLAMTKDPKSVSSLDKAQVLASSFAKAVQVDVTTCM
ncbi:DUF4190 domain-containing protein [Leifsonia sp. NPDC058194]|uniref:DUF4190 domain-containing protein n=1 Tax=Leifsonia sp. NPDC058194 TaxID=3346374 RepID=UPI0036DA5641